MKKRKKPKPKLTCIFHPEGVAAVTAMMAHLDIDCYTDCYGSAIATLHRLTGLHVGDGKWDNDKEAWLVPEEVANRVRLINGPHAKAMIKVMEARARPKK